MTADGIVRLPATPDAEVKATVALIAAARSSLAEARTLPDIRRVMEAAGVAEDAGRRAAKLAEAQRIAADVVEAANQAANDAAAVRLEAQAKAGELLREMQDSGLRANRGRREQMSHAATFGDLGVSRSESSRWQQVAGVPAEQRAEYVEETTATGGEVSTAGLLRHAAASTSSPRRSIDHVGIGAEARKNALKLYRELLSLAGFRPESLVSALDDRQKKYLLRTLDQLSAWLEEVRRELAVYRITRGDK